MMKRMVMYIGVLAIIFYYEIKSIYFFLNFLQNICLKLVVAWGVERRIIGTIFSFHRPIQFEGILFS